MTQDPDRLAPQSQVGLSNLMEKILKQARDGIEAQRGLNDVWPGDPYPMSNEIPSDAPDVTKQPYKIDRAVLDVIHTERVYQNRKWGTIVEHPHEVGGYLTLMRKLLSDAETAWAMQGGDNSALDEIRKVIAVGIACLEQHGPVGR